MEYFFGPDTFGAREEVGRIAKEQTLSIRFVDRGDLDGNSLGTIIDQAGSGLFGGSLVVVRDATMFPKSLQEQIVEFVKSKNSQLSALIVWDREKPDKRTEYFKALKKFGKEFSQPTVLELERWLQGLVKIEKAAVQELVVRSGTDKWALKNEAQRLSLAHTPITKEVVQQEVPPRDSSEEIFAALDALSSGNTSRAITLIETQLRSGESELYILSMIAYQFKTILAIKLNKTTGLHPFVVEKNQPAVRKYSANALQDILARIMATDFAIKQGKVDARTALMMLIVALVQTKTPAVAGR